jgi:hypothetical protein
VNVENFDTVTASAVDGGDDKAWLYDSAGDDTFVGQGNSGNLTGSNFAYSQSGFDIVQIISGSATTPHQIFIQAAAKLGSMQEVGVLLYEPPHQEPFEQRITAPVKGKK